MDPPQRAVPVPPAKIVVHRATWWQVLRQRRPLAASAQDVHHAIDDIALGHRALVAATLRGRDHRADQRPFFIGQVTGVAQLAPVIPTAVLLRPHPKASAKCAGNIGSQVIPKIQAVPGRTSNKPKQAV